MQRAHYAMNVESRCQDDYFPRFVAIVGKRAAVIGSLLQPSPFRSLPPSQATALVTTAFGFTHSSLAASFDRLHYFSLLALERWVFARIILIA